MKTLRQLILFDTALLFLLGVETTFGPPHSFPATYTAVTSLQDRAVLHLLGAALAGSAVVLMMQSKLTLISDLRRLALWLGLANGLIALIAALEQIQTGGGPEGWWPAVLVPLVMAAALAWRGWRRLRPEEIGTEIGALKIPEEIRMALLQQVGEAAAQEERNRLARDLHDSIKQQIFSINVSTAAAQARWDTDPAGARTALADVRRSAREAMVEMQALLLQLRPQALSSSTGLVAALREQCEALGYRTGAEVSLELGETIPDDRLPPGAQETLFRIAQESLANVARHARARKVRVWLGREGESAVLRVEDDGQGFDPGEVKSGMGLRNLRERAESLRGKLEIASAPGAGTRIAVHVPPATPPAPAESVAAARLEAGEALKLLFLPAMFLVLHAPAIVDMDFYAIAREGFAYLALLATLLNWWLARYDPRAFAGAKRSGYELHQKRAMSYLVSNWWVWGLASAARGNARALFLASALLGLVLVAVELIRLHRTSESRRFWREAGRAWLWIVLVVDAGVLLVVSLAAYRPGLLVLKPAESASLVILAAGLTYLASRRRLEGGLP